MAAHVTTPRLYALSPQDLAATVVSIVLVLAVVALAIQEKAVPSELGTALGAAITWLFVRSAQQAERNRPTIIDETKILTYPPRGLWPSPFAADSTCKPRCDRGRIERK